MKCGAILLCFLSLLPLQAAGTKKAGLTVPARYEGGTLPLNQHKITATIAEDKVVIAQGDRQFAVPIDSITDISYGADVRRRFGASVLGVVPAVHLDKTERHYIGMTWTRESDDGGKPSSVQAVLKLSSAECRNFLAALERLTGRKAVNTGKVPTVVRYAL